MKLLELLPEYMNDKGEKFVGYFMAATDTRIYSAIIQGGKIANQVMVCRLDVEPEWHFYSDVIKVPVPRKRIAVAIAKERRASKKFSLKFIEHQDHDGKRLILEGIANRGRQTFHFRLGEKDHVTDVFIERRRKPYLTVFKSPPLGLVAAIGAAIYSNSPAYRDRFIVRPRTATEAEKQRFREQFAGTPLDGTAAPKRETVDA